ncbi:MAG: right-handed parallel beta-helix repeat-containing protein [Calditrichaeota bacterium]|nr:right-handed parallel beta-helix repeat-containing protein [Calditrichota bacterium]
MRENTRTTFLHIISSIIIGLLFVGHLYAQPDTLLSVYDENTDWGLLDWDNEDGYVVNGDITIEGVEINISAGVVIGFNGEYKITVTDVGEDWEGCFYTHGTANDPVVFTNSWHAASNYELDGWDHYYNDEWCNIEILNSLSILEYTEFKDGGKFHEDQDFENCGYVVAAQEFTEMEIFKCRFYESKQCGIVVMDEAREVLIDGCEFIDCDSTGISCDPNQEDNSAPQIVEIKNCLISGSGGAGIDMEMYGGDAIYTVENCIINDGEKQGIYTHYRGEAPFEYDVTISSCVVSNNDGHGICISNGPTTFDEDVDISIYNNTVFSNGEDGFVFYIPKNDFADEKIKIINNVSWGNGGALVGNRRYAGFCFFFRDWPGGGVDDFLFLNNISGENKYGVYASSASESFDITYTGLKGNEFLTNSDSIEFDTTCVIFEEDDYFALVDEDPEIDDWDFHLVIDYVGLPQKEYDPGLHCATLNTGYTDQNNWEDWADPDPFDTPNDMGVFGGPLATSNINSDFELIDDYVLVTDEDFLHLLLANTAIDHFRFSWMMPTVDHGDMFSFESGAVLEYTGVFTVNGAVNLDSVLLIGDGIEFTDSTNTDSTSLTYCTIENAEYGVKLTGVDDLLGARLLIDHCFIDSCEIGIYANNSRVEITDTEITGCEVSAGTGSAITLINCSSGEVIIDNCDITDNGYDETYTSGAIYLSNSDPEIINTKVYENNGTGITCIGSSPDLDAYDAAGNQSNEIRDNGPTLPTGSDGAEIYLDASSTPDIKYNNIYDFDTSPDGYAIYMDDLNTSTITATYNWWGTTTPDIYESDLFYEGGGSITYTPCAASKYSVSDVDEYALAMRLWNEGDYETAARYFRRTIADSGAIGINSVHYLTGCVGEMEDGDFDDLRDFLIDVADRHSDEAVSHVAERWATHCLTEMSEYEDAMEEYDDRAQNADCLHDSVMAVIDYLAVEELYNGNRINSLDEDYVKQMHKLMSLLDKPDEEALTPETFTVARAYPNPFNSMTNISFNLREDSRIKLTIHDIQGREIAVLHEGNEVAGAHSVSWDATGLASGVYFCRLQSESNTATVKRAMVR